ncbi:MAG: acetyl-CoA C-acyltransferase [Alphaproteobacteria bacterium]|nr:acetyl-CoA C-acyltransferase [Alphaproteobacteria bacterium]
MNARTDRAVIVDGVRTPFVRAFAEYLDMDTIELGKAAVRGLLAQSGIEHSLVEGIVWGGVILPPGAPNVGREIALDLRLPPGAEAYTVTRACASGLQAITLAAAAIERGEADVLIAGGSDSTSNASLTLPPSFVRKVAPVAMSSKSGAADYFRVLSSISPARDLVPRKPEVAERSTGEVMGQAAERMAERNEITRAEQDAFTVMSHQRAAAAIASGRFASEVTPVTTPRGKRVLTDTIVRGDTSLDKLGKLRAAFKRGGTLTAGNSSALTDGAAAVLLMSERKARALGLTAKAAFRSWAYVGVDPADQLLMGPALAMPLALDRAGIALADVDLVDIHEAFAAQVLSVLKMMASPAFCKARLGRDTPVGEVDLDKLNVHGGSVSLGHPFGATGARMVTTMANELHLTGKQTAVLGICAAGGLGAAAVLERV